MFKSTENFNKLKLTTFKILYLPDEYSSILNLYFTKIYIYVCLKVDAKNKIVNPFDLQRISAGLFHHVWSFLHPALNLLWVDLLTWVLN